MKIYNYDHSGLFLSESDAELSPMESGKFMIPALATHIPPLATEAGFLAVFDRLKSKWSSQKIAEPAAAPAAPEITFEEKRLTWKAATSAYANFVAVAYGFESINEAVSYANEPASPKFQMLGQALRAWRSILWEAFDVLVAEVRGGLVKELANEGDLRARLPGFVAPDTSQIGIERYVAEQSPETEAEAAAEPAEPAAS